MGYHGRHLEPPWSTPDAYPRIYREGGFITPYAGDSTGFVEKWRTHRRVGGPALLLGHRVRRGDMNGLGAQGDPVGRRAEPGHHPFRGLGGGRSTSSTPASGSTTSTSTASPSTASTPTGSRTSPRSRTPSTPGTGRRSRTTWSVARRPTSRCGARRGDRAGLLPQPRSAQAGRRRPSPGSPGMTTRQVMTAVGQPYERLGSTYTFCARSGGDPGAGDGAASHPPAGSSAARLSRYQPVRSSHTPAGLTTTSSGNRLAGRASGHRHQLPTGSCK